VSAATKNASATAKRKRRKPVFHSLTVDVDIDESVLEDNGYHHEDDCPGGPEPDEPEFTHNDRAALQDWHDRAHGLSLWAMCQEEPCKLLSDDFRGTP